jgi:hypothetical protein
MPASESALASGVEPVAGKLAFGLASAALVFEPVRASVAVACVPAYGGLASVVPVSEV